VTAGADGPTFSPSRRILRVLPSDVTAMSGRSVPLFVHKRRQRIGGAAATPSA
jgi:hypothetical protein